MLSLCKIRRHAVLTTSRRILTDLSKLPEGIDRELGIQASSF
ncbi:MAG: hypothetical protein RIG27_04540 [Coleofasciculus sp. F4-SAH-05]